LLKETTGAFDGARTHNLHITSQTYLQHIAVCLLDFDYIEVLL